MIFEYEYLIFTLNIGCYSWINLSNPEYLYGQEQDTIIIYSQLSRVEFPEGFEFHSEYAEFNLLSWGKNVKMLCLKMECGNLALMLL